MITHTFNEELHQYAVDNELVPSVTQILELVGFSDVSAVPLARLEYKSAIGTEVHKACQFLDEDDLDLESVDEVVAGYVLGYQKFKQETGFAPRLIEHRLVAEVDGLRYGMCVDRFGDLNDETVIIDLKCTAAKGKCWGVQLGGYALGINPDARRAILHLKKDGNYKLIPYNDPEDLELFKSALKVTWWRIHNGLLRHW